MTKFIRVSAAAKGLGVAVGTLKKWIKAGLAPGRKTPTGYWMISEEDARRLYKESRPR